MTTQDKIEAIKDFWRETMSTEDLLEALLEAYTEMQESQIDEWYETVMATSD